MHIVMRVTTVVTSAGDLLAFARSCSPMTVPPMCMSGFDLKSRERVKLCYWTCNTDGCNGIRSFHYQLDFTKRRFQSTRDRRRRSAAIHRSLDLLNVSRPGVRQSTIGSDEQIASAEPVRQVATRNGLSGN